MEDIPDLKMLSSMGPFDPGSDNFRMARVAAMLLVVTGHFYNGFWWIPVLFGLWTFAFSCGLFSAARYPKGKGYFAYLNPKVLRLSVPLLTAQIVVLAACLIRGRMDLVNPDSFFSLLGLTRVAAWLGIEKVSPLGNGLLVALVAGTGPWQYMLQPAKAT